MLAHRLQRLEEKNGDVNEKNQYYIFNHFNINYVTRNYYRIGRIDIMVREVEENKWRISTVSM